MRKLCLVVAFVFSICLVGCGEKNVSLADLETIETSPRGASVSDTSVESIESNDVISNDTTSNNNTSNTVTSDTEPYVGENIFKMTEAELEHPVRIELGELLYSDDFQAADLAKRQEIMNDFLMKKQGNGIVSGSASYDAKTYTYLFTYDNGVPGSVVIYDVNAVSSNDTTQAPIAESSNAGAERSEESTGQEEESTKSSEQADQSENTDNTNSDTAPHAVNVKAENYSIGVAGPGDYQQIMDETLDVTPGRVLFEHVLGTIAVKSISGDSLSLTCSGFVNKDDTKNTTIKSGETASFVVEYNDGPDNGGGILVTISY